MLAQICQMKVVIATQLEALKLSEVFELLLSDV